MSGKGWPKPARLSPSSSPDCSPSSSNCSSADGPSHSTDWFSIYVAAALSFVGTVQFSLYFSSIWPYLQMIDRTIDETQFGWVIAIYSVGQIISAPLFGFLSNRICQVRLPLIVGLAMMFVGNIAYLSLELVSIRKLYVLLFCRFITGMGSGNVCLLRTYASTGSTNKDRSRAIAFVTCGQALGATGGPAFQLLFTFIPYPGLDMFGFSQLKFNLFTAPAFLACLMNIVGAVVLLTCFTEHYAGLNEAESAEGIELGKQRNAGKVEQISKLKLPPYDWVACAVCYLSRFTQMFVQGNMETIGSPYAMMMFAWAEHKAVEVTSMAQGLVGGITFATYIVYISVRAKNEPDYRLSCILSFVGLMAFHLLTYSWPFLPTSVTMFNETQSSLIKPVGCNATKFSWCQDLGQVNVWLYYCSYVICIGLAFPILNIAMNTLFSHVLGPRRQGTQQGFFQIAGTVARLIGPIMMSTLYSLYGPNMAWLMELLVSGITLALWTLFYRRMVPLMPAVKGRGEDEGDEDTQSTGTAFSRLEEEEREANGQRVGGRRKDPKDQRQTALAKTMEVVFERDGKLSVVH